jgi:catechol 2,3-dioxygenase-like lactoylglutathione lyase family enzyme
MQLNQVTVAVTDIEKSIEFYKALGLKLIVQAEHYARFMVPGNTATFSVHKAGTVAPSATVVYFETDDLDKTVLALKEKGLLLTAEPVQQSWLWYEAYLCDPDGNNICIYHAGENRLNPPWRITE